MEEFYCPGPRRRNASVDDRSDACRGRIMRLRGPAQTGYFLDEK